MRTPHQHLDEGRPVDSTVPVPRPEGGSSSPSNHPPAWQAGADLEPRSKARLPPRGAGHGAQDDSVFLLSFFDGVGVAALALQDHVPIFQAFVWEVDDALVEVCSRRRLQHNQRHQKGPSGWRRTSFASTRTAPGASLLLRALPVQTTVA